MSFTVELMYRYEGIVESAHIGLEQEACELSEDYQSALHALRIININTLFASPERVREQYMVDLLLGSPIQGIWSETLLPIF